MSQNRTVAEINGGIENNLNEYISQCESNFDSSLNRVVSEFLSDSEYDIVLLTGPSSSGKTTTANKIAQKIREKNRNAFTVSLDDFYLNRDDIPLTESGIKDFENIYALDLDFIHETFKKLITERKADLPLFDFLTGQRRKETNHIELSKTDVIVVEGIHALNPLITEGLNENHIFKIYISVSSRVIDEKGKTALSKRDLRLIRRLVRDYRHRGTSPERTLLQWPGVLKGEDKYLFPYEANANCKINSFHPYEPCIFKDSALELLSEIKPESEFYEKAKFLIDCLANIDAISAENLPKNSLLREFLG